MCVVRQLTSLGKPAGVSRSVRRRSWSWRASAEERVEEEECNRAPPAPPTFPAIGRSAANDAPSEKGTDIGMGTVRVAITILAGEGAIAGQGLLCGGRGRKGERGTSLDAACRIFFYPSCAGMRRSVLSGCGALGRGAVLQTTIAACVRSGGRRWMGIVDGERVRRGREGMKGAGARGPRTTTAAAVPAPDGTSSSYSAPNRGGHLLCRPASPSTRLRQNDLDLPRVIRGERGAHWAAGSGEKGAKSGTAPATRDRAARARHPRAAVARHLPILRSSPPR
jgi:hypothetical protein